MSRGIRAVVGALVGAVALSPVVVSGGGTPAAAAAVPCVVVQGYTPPIDLSPGQSRSVSFTVIGPDDRTDLTLVDLDVSFAFIDYQSGPRIYLDHEGRTVQLMGEYPTSPKSSFSLTYDDEASAPLAQDSPSGGRYQPPTGYPPLTTFDGSRLHGEYVLRIDNTSGAAVHLRDWKLVMSSNTCDSDGDGVEEKADNCPTVANADQTDWDADRTGNACDATPGSAPTGTCSQSCTYARTVGLRHRAAKHRLVGKVTSDAVGCRSAVPVTIWRKRRGNDRKLVVVTTRATGSYRTKAPRAPGRYYATVGSAAEPLCAADSSRTLRIRRR